MTKFQEINFIYVYICRKCVKDQVAFWNTFKCDEHRYNMHSNILSCYKDLGWIMWVELSWSLKTNFHQPVYTQKTCQSPLISSSYNSNFHWIFIRNNTWQKPNPSVSCASSYNFKGNYLQSALEHAFRIHHVNSGGNPFRLLSYRKKHSQDQD